MKSRETDQRTIRVGSDLLDVVVSGEESSGAAFAARVTIPAGGGPPMLHRHDSFELYRIDEGELCFYRAGDGEQVERTVAATGELVAIPGGQEHTIRNESQREAHALVVFAPGTDMEPFFRAAAALDEPAPEAVMALAAEHGIQTTRPIPDGVSR
jgi:mannose-6-phosphate isomerase-like protein (cupin superfamily)